MLSDTASVLSARFSDGVAAIRRGEAEHIDGEFPQDVAPLAAEVNQLIDANREIVERARTQVGNLAHALKTPLSVLINEADSGSPNLPEKVHEQTEIMRRQVASISTGPEPQRAPATVGVVTDVKPVVEGLVRTFEKLHAERGLNFTVQTAGGLEVPRRVAGSDRSHRQPARQRRQMGARNRIHPRLARVPAGARTPRAFLIAEIDDDGPGLEPDARAEAIGRGKRLDESRPGSGLGLSIVVELAAIYGGSLRLEESPFGGLRAVLLLPCV